MHRYPVDEILPRILGIMRDCPSAVVHAPPGAGKTTRVPIALLEAFPPEKGRIVIVEPRRLAAVSAARWMAKTLGEEVGKTAGYTIRFERRTSRATRIEVVTEGILTRRILHNPGLDGVAMIIFDEFHERSLGSELALAFCLDIRSSIREDLKIMMMSATLDCGPVSSLLGGAPVCASAGRSYPVEELYLGESAGMRLHERVAFAVKKALQEDRGDILVFLPGYAEIRLAAEAVSRHLDAGKADVEVHPLYGDLPAASQQSAIVPSRSRKVVLATNIAETGLTIEGVGIVIDSGLTRRLQHDPRTGMNRLLTVNVSKASAEQRKGRAGRLGPGVCYRLYSRYQFDTMVPFAPPEMMTADLSELALQLAAWGTRDPRGLCWLDAPPRSSWDAAVDLLRSLGAVDHDGWITPLGKEMARLPLHPRLSRLAIGAYRRGHAGLGADLAALLSERDVIRSASAAGGSPGKDREISTRIEALRIWRGTGEKPGAADGWTLRAADRASHRILSLMGAGREREDRAADDDLAGRLLAAAFPDRIAKRREEGSGRYLLAQGRGIRLSADSTLVNSEYIVAADLDAGEKGEGMVHLAAPLTEGAVREECDDLIVTERMVKWSEREGRVIAVIEERLGEILLSSRPFPPGDDEAVSCLCDAIRGHPDMLVFSRAARQFMGMVALIAQAFPEEEWPDLAEASLASRPETWLAPWLTGVRSARHIAGIDLLPPMKGLFTSMQLRQLERRAPAHLTVPSGHRVALDYTKGEAPVLAVKLQEMFGLADTPSVAEGRVRVLLHLLSPAGRPVQITADLAHFWDSVYPQVRKELRGRYPKHPWPEDPWSAEATRRTKPRSR